MLRKGPQKSFRLIALNSVILKQVVFFNQKNKWNLEVKTNFENFDFQVSPTPIIALILIKMHHFQTSNIILYSEFTN